MWTDDQLRLLIDERRNRNAEYYDISGSSRVNFWNTIANIINERFGGTYTGQQYNNRFKNLVRDHTLIEQYIAGSRTGKRSRTGERYFEEFRSRFWERPETPFDILHNENTSARRRHRNRTPPPTYEVPSILSTSRRESTANQRNRSASPTRRIPSERDENSNRNNPASQNDSDFSMPDAGQPLEPINEEGSWISFNYCVNAKQKIKHCFVVKIACIECLPAEMYSVFDTFCDSIIISLHFQPIRRSSYTGSS
ncbi:hypothetical protein Glove_490g16 [Diversispora epigaea]|uniref:Myb/SANT-like domain-containing protein n=1 Tax=Diversispora epigaea TaxID=1348612 RepID=A0A397GK09_9GLOM|nr:hypothetical protein Glove_490g16 [Diversispora epigaea]